MQWKDRLPAGIVYDHPVSALDLGATIVAHSGAEVPKDKPLDGVNLIPYLKGQKKTPPHETIYLRKFDQNRFAVRHGNEKVVVPWKGAEPLLFDLSKDISETNNLAVERPERVKKLEELRKSWNEELIDPTFEGLMLRKLRKDSKSKKR